MNRYLALERTLTRLAGGVAIVISLAMPGLFFLVSYKNLSAELAGDARVTALEITEYITQNPDLWTFHKERLVTMLGARGDGNEVMRLVDGDGKILAASGLLSSWATLAQSAPVYSFGRETGRVVALGSMVGLFAWTGLFAMVGALIGALVYFPLRRIPLRALHEANRALRESEAQNRAVVASLREGVMLVNEAHQLLAANDGARHLFGERLADWAQGGDSAAYLITEQGEALLDQDHPITRVLNTNEPIQDQVLGLKREGAETVWLRLNARPVARVEGVSARAVVVSLSDISEIKRGQLELEKARDAAEAANRAKSEFLANMSHELRTPLNGVLGMAQLLGLDDNLTPEQRDQLEVIRESGESLLRIIDDILEFAKLEVGSARLNPRVFDPRERIGATLRLHLPVAAARNLTLDWSVADDVPLRVRGDPARLAQVLANLVGNAIKFTEQGGVRVSVVREADGERVSSDTCRLRISVKDSGIGMTEAVRAGLFRRFTQGDGSSTRKYGGTGLGLAICHQMVTLMGGEIQVESTPGQGATFWFTVPLEVVEEAPAETAAPVVEANPASRRRILVVEDNAVNLLVAENILESLGCTVIGAGDGRQGVEAWERGGIDLVFMDCQMPVMDGFEATAYIRDRERARPAAGHIPIVAMTANAMPQDRARCIDAGMDDYLSKPYNLDQLRTMLDRWLPSTG